MQNEVPPRTLLSLRDIPPFRGNFRHAPAKVSPVRAYTFNLKGRGAILSFFSVSHSISYSHSNSISYSASQFCTFLNNTEQIRTGASQF